MDRVAFAQLTMLLTELQQEYAVDAIRVSVGANTGDSDTPAGSVFVTMSSKGVTVSSSAVHLQDAALLAKAKLDKAFETPADEPKRRGRPPKVRV